ncbi:IS4 family transposase [Magnetospira thiophila]
MTAWRISWMTWLRRTEPASTPRAVFTDTELALLDRTAPATRPGQARNLDFYIVAVARLGGYLARRHDPPPGTTVLWRGFSRLADLVMGFEAAYGNGKTLVGN